MVNKWMIMFAGIGTVFVALIGLIAMISIFHLIFGAKTEKKRPSPAPLPEINGPTVASPTERPQVSKGQEGAELIAVISAAIAAATGKSPAAFHIRSISVSPESEGGFNTPVWGRIERFARK